MKCVDCEETKDNDPKTEPDEAIYIWEGNSLCEFHYEHDRYNA